MKTLRKVVCITTLAAMLFSSMGIGAFAAEGVDGTNAPSLQQQDGDNSGNNDPTRPATEVTTEPAVNNVNGDLDADATKGAEAEPSLQCDIKVRTVSGHQRIKVAWTAGSAKLVKETTTEGVDGETGETTTQTTPTTLTKFIVYRAPAGCAVTADNPKCKYCEIELNPNGTIKRKSGNAFNSSYKSCDDWGFSSKWDKPEIAKVEYENGEYYLEDKDVGDGLMDNRCRAFRGREWTYKVVPVAGTYAVDLAEVKGVTDNCIRTSYVKLTLKVKKTLTSHDKQKKKKSFKKGTTIYTCAFGYGKYVFIYGDNMYWLNRIGTKKQSTGYDRLHPYTDEEVLYYINGRDLSADTTITQSATSRLIWVNTYTQRIYVFKKGNGKWDLEQGTNASWKVSTGKAATPTIRYIDPKNTILDTGRVVAKYKTINKKKSKRHGIPSWNCFSTWNAIHGQKKSWNINAAIPKSNGCVRNTNAHANWIYKYCPKNTRVLIF